MAKSYLGGGTLITRYSLLPKRHKVKIKLYINAKEQAKAQKHCSEVRRIDPTTGEIIESINPREVIRARKSAAKQARAKERRWRRYNRKRRKHYEQS